MRTFEIRRNTLPYIHPYSIIHLSTGKTVGQYRTHILAEQFLKKFEQYGINYAQKNLNTDISNGFTALDNRMNNPDGHKPIIPQTTKYTRKIEIYDNPD